MRKIVFLFLVSISIVKSQSFKHRSFKFNWKKTLQGSFEKVDEFKNQNCVILFEKVEFDCKERILFKHQVIQFDTQESIDKFNYFRVPINVNPYKEIPKNGNLDIPDSIQFPKIMYDKIIAFDARIIRDNKIEMAILKENATKKYELVNNIYRPYYVHSFYVRNLNPGDQLEIITKQYLDIQNFSFVLSEKLPKQNITYTIKNLPYGWLINKSENFNINLSELNVTKGKYSTIDATFKFAKLASNDPAIHTPYNEVIQLTLIPQFYLSSAASITSKDIYDTLSWKYFIYQLTKSYFTTDMHEYERFDMNNINLNKYFENIKTTYNLTLNSDIVKMIHTIFIQSFSYSKDEKVYQKLEAVDNTIATYIKNKVFRKYYSNLYYHHILDRSKLKHYVAILYDNRNYLPDSTLVNYEISNRTLYAVQDEKENYFYFLEKNTPGGYYINELPFYYLNKFYLIPQNLPFKQYELGYKKQEINVLTPSLYEEEDNYRITNSQVNIDFTTNKYYIQCTRKLSGQYSTLLRDYVKYKHKDESIHHSYFDDFMTQQSITPTILKEATEYPFDFWYEYKSDVKSNIFQNNDGNTILIIQNIVNTFYQLIDTNYFHSSYRHDFKGYDTYNIKIISTEKFTILNHKEFDFFINTEDFTLSCVLNELNDYEWELKIISRITSDTTNTNTLNLLIDYFNKIIFLRKGVFKLKKL